MNIERQQPYRKTIRVGDVFAYRLAGRYRFGRVIRKDARAGAVTDCILIYLYRANSDREHQIPRLDPHDFLCPPLLVEQSLWRQGYFETVESRPLQAADLLPQHCFWSTADERWVDEYDRPLEAPTWPNRGNSLTLINGIDRLVSAAVKEGDGADASKS